MLPPEVELAGGNWYLRMAVSHEVPASPGMPIPLKKSNSLVAPRPRTVHPKVRDKGGGLQLALVEVAIWNRCPERDVSLGMVSNWKSCFRTLS